MKSLLRIEIKEEYENGKRIFENGYLENVLLEDMALRGIQFKNCKFRFSSFRHTDLSNAKFVNCEFFFQSFFSADLTGTVFEHSKIEIARFDEAVFERTFFRRCNLNYVAMLNVNLGAIDFTDSIKFKVISNLADATEEDVMKAVGLIAANIGDMDIDLKAHLKKVVERYSGELGLDVNPDSVVKSNYKDQKAGYNAKSNPYAVFSGVFDNIINYNKSGNYKENETVYNKKGGKYQK